MMLTKCKTALKTTATTTKTIAPNSSAYVSTLSKSGDKMPKTGDNMPKNGDRVPKQYQQQKVKKAASIDLNGMPNEKTPSATADLVDKMPNCSTEPHHSDSGIVPAMPHQVPMPSLASSSSFVDTSSDSFLTIRRNCERHMRRLERYKKARSFCSLDTAEAEEQDKNNNGRTAPAEGGNDVQNKGEQHRQKEQCPQAETTTAAEGDKGGGFGGNDGGEQFETLRAKMLTLMENDMLLLAKLLQLGETLCELRSKQEEQQQQQQQQHQQQQTYANGGRTASCSSSGEQQGQHGGQDGDHYDDHVDQHHHHHEHQNGFLDDEEEDEISDTAPSPRALLHRARQYRRRAPLPPEFGRASAVTRVYLAGEQQTNDAIRRQAVPDGGAVGSDHENADEEEDDQINPNVQYFSRKNSVLRIPIPPRASNRNFGRPKFHQRLNSSNFSSSSPSCCASAASASSLMMLAAHAAKMPSCAVSSLAHCVRAKNDHGHLHLQHSTVLAPSTIVETDLLMDSGHSSASSEADPQQNSPPGAPSSRFSTFSSSLSIGSASSRSLFAAAALAAAAVSTDAAANATTNKTAVAKRTKSAEERHAAADGSRSGGDRRAVVTKAEKGEEKTTIVNDQWKTNCTKSKSSFSD